MSIIVARTLTLLFLAVTFVRAQAPPLINYQGRLAVGGVNFDGAGEFKFALVNADGTTSYWSNDGTSTAGSEPSAAVTLTVSDGRYSVLLGDTRLPNMAVMPASVFNVVEVFLRVWFNDGSNGSQLLAPDQHIVAQALGNRHIVRDDGGGAINEAWQQFGDGTIPTARHEHSVVWTGSEMIVWGGIGDGPDPYLNSGGRYNPASNTWAAVTTEGAPSKRRYHTAVWTGSEMIVWGGDGLGPTGTIRFNTGGRYNPADNSWKAVSTMDAPSARFSHTAVWTGSEMIIWGGSALNSGGRYRPEGNNWTEVSTAGAPAGRLVHTAVWTGTEMIVWGGFGDGGYLNSGGRYHPAGNTWAPISTDGAPTGRRNHTAVWTGGKMIVWGGDDGSGPSNDGGCYNPAGYTWTAVTTTGAPSAHTRTAVWTGSEMIVWGRGAAQGPNAGGRFDPAANTWTAVTTAGAPSARIEYTAVWTGSEMIVWGGINFNTVNANWDYFSDGGRYDPASNSWTKVSSPHPRSGHTAVWTGSEMIVWGGAGEDSGYLNDGGRYDRAGNNWLAVSTIGAPSARYGHTAVWTGSEMIVWGGYNGGAGAFTLNDGGRYQPAANSWTPLSSTGAPSGRADHTAVWTGSEMIVWGGSSDDALNDGGRYEPVANSWTAVSTMEAPPARWGHTAVWTGREMIIWGGTPQFSGGLNNGGRYHPADNSWTTVSTKGAPAARRSHTAVWAGNEMIVWGGGAFPDSLNDGGRYEPEQNLWTPMNTAGAPDARFFHTAVWTGSEMIVWGGTRDLFNGMNSGGRYHPADNRWRTMTTAGAPAARRNHTAVWNGREMIVWGGWDSTRYFNDIFSYTPDCGVFDFTSVTLEGGKLTLTFPTVPGRTYTLWRSDTIAGGTWINTGLPALAGTGATLTFTIPASNPARRFFRVQADP